MKKRAFIVMAGMSACLILATYAGSEDGDSRQSELDPLAPFEQLVGGRWDLGESYQEFEWGVGRRSVKARSFFVVEGTPMLVSEGIWFWHPGEERIKGVFTAVEMPVDFFDYTTRFEGKKMVSELVSYGAEGGKTAYTETWEFTDASHFVWKLFEKTPDGLQEVMGGTYSKTE